MSNGYILAAEADRAVAHDIAQGFGLEVLTPADIGALESDIADLAGAANIGVILSTDAASDGAFVALMRRVGVGVRSAQLILATPEARGAFGFLPEGWAVMSLADARARADELTRRRNESAGAGGAPRAQPLPPVVEPEPAPPPVGQQAEPEPPPPIAQGEIAPEEEPSVGAPPEDDVREQTAELEDAIESGEAPGSFGGVPETAAPPPIEEERAPEPAAPPVSETPASRERGITMPPPASAAPEAPPPVAASPTPAADAPDAAAPAPQPAPPRQRTRAPAESAPADATAFAPKKLRRGSPELVRIVIHQPKDLGAVVKAARKLDPRTDPAPSGMKIGDVAIGASVAVSLEVRGAACDGALQRRTWTGEAIDFNFSAEADADVKQAVFLARVFVDDAQIGVLAFTRPVGGAHAKAHSGERIRLKRHKRVFLSYSSKDRETVAAIATAYEAAGVQHFFDRTSLKSGEEWSPRLRREIERADLFHLCWSKSAAASEWVEKEAEHALTRRRRNKKPEITVQMLDGPPWAPHPPHLDSINFDDFVRAAIVGYARGDGES